MADLPESRKAVALTFVEAINRRNVDDMARLVTADFVFVDPLGMRVEGWEKMKSGWTAYFGMVPDYTIAIEETYADGPVVLLFGTARGTYAAEGRMLPENRWQTPAAWWAGIRGTQVAERRVYADNEPMRQLMAKSRRTAP